MSFKADGVEDASSGTKSFDPTQLLEMSRLQDLPSELILEIQSYLSLGDINNLSDCSRSLRRLNSNLKQGIDLSPLSMVLDDEILQILISTNFKSTRLPNSKLNWVNISNCDSCHIRTSILLLLVGSLCQLIDVFNIY